MQKNKIALREAVQLSEVFHDSFLYRWAYDDPGKGEAGLFSDGKNMSLKQVKAFKEELENIDRELEAIVDGTGDAGTVISAGRVEVLDRSTRFQEELKRTFEEKEAPKK